MPDLLELRTEAGAVVCTRCRVADSLVSRTRGLLGVKALDADEGLLIRRTSSVHTHFMRFAIDVVFVDADGRVVKVVHDLRPWRLAGCRGARDVVELPSGTCARVGLVEGARLVEAPARTLGRSANAL